MDWPLYPRQWPGTNECVWKGAEIVATPAVIRSVARSAGRGRYTGHAIPFLRCSTTDNLNDIYTLGGGV
jgi:hypothetical protein